MSRRSAFGNRDQCFFLRMHPEELKDLTRRAAQHGLSRPEYARARLLEQVIPTLPAVIPVTAYRFTSALAELRKQAENLTRYCSANGPIAWDGQEELGCHVHSEGVLMVTAIAALQKALPEIYL